MRSMRTEASGKSMITCSTSMVMGHKLNTLMMHRNTSVGYLLLVKQIRQIFPMETLRPKDG
jgi:hypothetical protein